MSEVITLARPYAKAAYRFAKSEAVVEQWSRQLAVSGGLMLNEDVAVFIRRPGVSDEALVELLCGSDADDEYVNFIRLMAENNRLSLLPQVVQLFQLYREQDQSIQAVDVYTAFELSDVQRLGLIAALKKRTGKEISLTSHIDKTLIGGAKIYCGDLVIDGSLRGKIDRMRTKLTN